MLNNAYIFDAHCDTLCMLAAGHTINEDNAEMNLSTDRLNKGGVGVQCFAAFVSVETIDVLPMRRALTLIEQFDKLISGGDYVKIKTTKDIDVAIAAGKTGAMLTLEGGDVLEGNINNLYRLYELGARMLTLTWNNKNAISDGIMSEDNTGLTDFGHKIVGEMERIGMVVDVSHISRKGFWDVASAAKKPFVASHSNALSCCSFKRNLDDEQLRALAKAGGVTGINFCASFLKDDSKAYSDDIIRHIEYINALVGEGHVGFGSDFDGVANNLPADVRNPAAFADIAERLLRLNYSDETLKGIMYGNFLRVFKSVIG